MPDLESVLLANARQHLGSLRAAVSEGADFWQVRDSITAVKTLLSFGAEANLSLAESVRSDLACIDLEVAALEFKLQEDGRERASLQLPYRSPVTLMKSTHRCGPSSTKRP